MVGKAKAWKINTEDTEKELEGTENWRQIGRAHV